MANIIGNNPDIWVKNQVDLRQQLLGLKNRPPSVLAWQNNKTAWIRAISAVTVTNDKAKELTGRENMGGPKLAQEYVLFNGTIGLESQTDGEGNTTYKQKTNAGVYNGQQPNNSAYGFEYDSERGLVPMPGITDLTISTYNRGSLRKASLKVKAYNKKQFAALDALFMRPGYTLLIEWGHTAYFTGTPEKPKYNTAKFNTKPFLILNEFLEGKAKGNQKSILQSIKRERGNGTITEFETIPFPSNSSEGNYDGFYGKVTNFVWNLNPDGSYNIEIKAISTGDIIESLTIDTVTSVVDSQPDQIKAASPPVIDETDYYVFNINRFGKSIHAFRIKEQFREYWDDLFNGRVDGAESLFRNLNPNEILNSRFQSVSTSWSMTNTSGQPNPSNNINSQITNPYNVNSIANINPQPGNAVPGVQGNISDKQLAYITQYQKAYQKYKSVQKFTLKPPSNTYAKEEPAEDILLVNRDRSKLNRFLFDNYNYLKKRSRAKNIKKVPTYQLPNETKKRGAVKTINTMDVPENGTVDGFEDLIMIIPSVLLELTDGITGNSLGGRYVQSKNAPYQYMKLKRLLEFIQEELLIYNGGDIGKGEDDKHEKDNIPFIEFDLDGENYMYTQPTQFSSDPNVCLIPFNFPLPVEKNTQQSNIDDVFEDNISYFNEVLAGCDFRLKESKFVANLLEIPVNLHYIGRTLQQVTTNNSVPLLKFLEQILYGIQEALGSINKFSVTYDHDENEIVFRDDIPLDPKIATKTKVVPTERTLFNVNGIQKDNQNASFITNVNLTTTLSNKFATMISIGAQANTKSDIANSTSFGRWNAGLRDSVTPTKLSKTGALATAKQANKPKSLFDTSIISLNKPTALLVSFYQEVKMPSGNVQSTAQSLNSSFNKYVATTLKKEQTPSSQGFIPFSMNLDMDGFSGLRIYEKFYITTEILPDSYPETLSFICKGLTHTVNNSGWKTKIDSLTITSVDDDTGNNKLEIPRNKMVNQFGVNLIEGLVF